MTDCVAVFTVYVAFFIKDNISFTLCGVPDTELNFNIMFNNWDNAYSTVSWS